MRILVAADLHWREYSSLVRKFGSKYSVRLENAIQTMNWLEEKATELNCDMICFIGDFFDRAELTDQEITASKDIVWNNLKHYFLVGNHESGESDLQFNSTKILESSNRVIISEPTILDLFDCELCFLPYIPECNKKPLGEYFPNRTEKPRIILSHNDLKGIQMGPILSRLGFELDEIEQNCDLFLNGHLHNGQNISDSIINLGNITGRDFGEDALRYSHNAALIDTEKLTLKLIENPYALNFYKLEINQETDLLQLERLKNNAVLSIKCLDLLIPQVKQILDKLETKVVDYRIIATKILEDSKKIEEKSPELSLQVDHLTRFVECCRQHIENSDILEIELGEICK